MQTGSTCIFISPNTCILITYSLNSHKLMQYNHYCPPGTLIKAPSLISKFRSLQLSPSHKNFVLEIYPNTTVSKPTTLTIIFKAHRLYFTFQQHSHKSNNLVPQDLGLIAILSIASCLHRNPAEASGSA